MEGGCCLTPSLLRVETGTDSEPPPACSVPCENVPKRGSTDTSRCLSTQSLRSLVPAAIAASLVMLAVPDFASSSSPDLGQDQLALREVGERGTQHLAVVRALQRAQDLLARRDGLVDLVRVRLDTDRVAVREGEPRVDEEAEGQLARGPGGQLLRLTRLLVAGLRGAQRGRDVVEDAGADAVRAHRRRGPRVLGAARRRGDREHDGCDERDDLQTGSDHGDCSSSLRASPAFSCATRLPARGRSPCR